MILATGASYRRLGVPALEALERRRGLLRRPGVGGATRWPGEDVFVVGGANSAGQAALHLARYARRVTLVVRAAVARAPGCRTTSSGEIEATPNVEVRLGTEVVGGGGDGRLEHLVLRERAAGAERDGRAPTASSS